MSTSLISPRHHLPAVPVKAVVAVLIAALVVSAIVVYRTRFAPKPAPAFTTATVTRGTVTSTVTATGPISAAAAVPLNFKQSGKLTSIDVRVGDQVKAGQVLATLDPSDFEASLQQAQSSLASSQAAYNKLVQQPLPTDIAAAKATVDVAATQLVTAQHSLASAEEAASKDVAAAQQVFDDAARNLKSTQTQIEASTAQDGVAVANAQRALADAHRTAQALPAVIQQQVEQAKDKLYADQVTYDAQVARGQASKEARQAALNADQTALDQANASAVQQLTQSQQALNQAQSTLDSANASLKNDEAKFQGTLIAAQTQLNNAQSSLASARAKSAQGIQASQDQVASAQSALAQARANFDKSSAPATQPDLDAANAQVASAQAAIKLAQNNLDSATLVAPSDGAVTAINGAIGQWITGGATSGAAASSASGANTTTTQTTMISLTSLSGLQITAQVNEADISRVKTGQKVSFTVDAFASRTFGGTVAAIQPLGTTSSNVVTYAVLIDTEQTDVQLLPGMTASANITTGDAEDVLKVAVSALTFARTSGSQTAPRSPSGAQTLYVLKDGKANPVRVQLGISDGKVYQVLSGLNEGDQVITAGGAAGSVSGQQGGGGLFGFGGPPR